ncbi:MAG: purine-nucleoside phosphorylase [Candidatus Eremiobacteraeota bacterium]|nr:purine-nucleoside phosphorylase [Candidatus Eremiobacteraeota bacterium]
MLERRSATEKILIHDASTVESIAGGKIDVALVLGSGLSSIIGGSFSYTAIPYDRMLGMPVTSLEGHAGEALIGKWGDKRVLVFAGRAHLYQGFSAAQVTTNVRLAHAAGARAVVLTNAAGALDPQLKVGSLMLITDHINLTGRNPLTGVTVKDPFIDMSDAYSARMRELVKRAAKPNAQLAEGVYAGVSGPSFETPAETDYLRRIGASAVGMSTVLETILARSMGLSVLGISVISNVAGTRAPHSDIVAAAGAAGPRLGELIDALLPHL